MTVKITFQRKPCNNHIRRFLLLILIIVLLGSCEKEPQTGSLLISTEYDGTPEGDVECWLYESYYKFQHYEYLQKELSDELGEVYFDNLEAGWYLVEARKTKSSLFKISDVDSVEIEAGRRTNKILILFPE